jgi:hypothetical protein
MGAPRSGADPCVEDQDRGVPSAAQGGGVGGSVGVTAAAVAQAGPGPPGRGAAVPVSRPTGGTGRGGSGQRRFHAYAGRPWAAAIGLHSAATCRLAGPALSLAAMASL